MADIFLSYARADQSRVEPIAAALEQAGYSVWWDRHIEGGSEFSKDIEKQIDDARAVIVVWSAASVESEWVRDEATFARDADKLVPVSIDHTLPPLGFRQRQSIDLGQQSDADAGMPSLKIVLDRMIEGEFEEIAPIATSQTKYPIALFVTSVILLIAVAGFFVFRSFGDGVVPVVEVTENTGSDSVAVLPFVAQSSSEEDQYFADGVTEEILNRLDALEELRVLPRTTVFSLRDNQERLDTLTETLGVDYVVEGSLRRGGDAVRVSARLVRGRDGETLWSNSYDGSYNDVLQFQSDIAEKVAASLDVLLDEKTLKRMKEAGVDDPEAFSLYAEAFELNQSGHISLASGSMSALYESSQLFDQAYEASPKLWRALVNASDVYSHIIFNQAAGIESDELPYSVRQNPQAEMQARLKKARSMAPNRQEQLAVELYARAFTDDWSQIPELSKEYYANHNGCEVANWAGFLIESMMQIDDVAEAYIRMEDCRAGDQLYVFFTSGFLAKAGRFDEARALLDRERERGLVEAKSLDRMQSNVEHYAGNIDEAMTLADFNDGIWSRFLRKLLQSDETVVDEINEFLSSESIAPWLKLPLLSVSGQRDKANAFAAALDAKLGGPTVLQEAVDSCDCGAPFDIEYTPNYAAVLERSGFDWPMKNKIYWPMKDW